MNSSFCITIAYKRYTRIATEIEDKFNLKESINPYMMPVIKQKTLTYVRAHRFSLSLSLSLSLSITHTHTHTHTHTQTHTHRI